MSNKLPFVVTLLVAGVLVGWLYAHDGSLTAETRAPAASAKMRNIVRYPDPQGIVLELRQQPASACAGARFRAESPTFALWEDGTVVYRTSTYDFRRATVAKETSDRWIRTLRAHYPREERDGCLEFWSPDGEQAWTQIRGRDAKGAITIQSLGLARCAAGHADFCARCQALRPFARLVEEISTFKAGENDIAVNLPMEVYLEFKSCGCRDHPDIARASQRWVLSGPTPWERCGKSSARFRLDDPSEIRWLAKAIEGSAAVIDGEEIYTCFMRPLLQPRQDLALARK